MQEVIKRTGAKPLWLILLFFCSLLLRYSLVSKGPYHSDTIAFAYTIDNAAVKNAFPRLHGHGYPFTAVLGVASYKIASLFNVSDPVRAVNLLSVLLSALCVFSFYSIAAGFLSETAAFMATAFFILNPVILSISEYGNSHAPALLLALVSLNFLMLYKKTVSIPYLLLSGFFFGLLGAARIQDAFVLTAPFCFCYFTVETCLPQEKISPPAPKKKLFLFFCACVLAGLTITAFYLPLWMGRGPGYYNLRLLAFNVFEPFSDIATLYHIKLSSFYLSENFSLAGLVLSLFGVIYLYRQQKRSAQFLLLWFLVPFLFYGNHFMVTPRWLTPAVVPLIIFEAAAIDALFQVKRLYIKALTVIFLCFLLTYSLARIFPVLLFRHRNAVTVDYARWIESVTEEDALIIAGDDGVFIRYYTERDVLRQIVTDTSYFRAADTLLQELKDYKKRLEDMLILGRPVYVTEIGLKSNNQGLFHAFLTKFFRLKYVGESSFEVWHRACLWQRLLRVKLFKIELRPSDAP